MTCPAQRRLRYALALTLLVATAGRASADPSWTPAAWKDLDTLEIKTIGAEEGEHWSTLWLVVIDDAVYLRLGSRAAGRVQGNTAAPYVAVRIADREFAQVRAEDAPAARESVAQAMGEKYFSDFLIRLFPHPMTVRLTPTTAIPAAAP
jgi:hypothetical protein